MPAKAETASVAPVPVVTPEHAVADVAEQVAALVSGGIPGHGEATALTGKLEAAQYQLDKGNAQPAANVLGAFINQIEALVNSGRLSAEKAQPPVDSSNTPTELIEAEPSGQPPSQIRQAATRRPVRLLRSPGRRFATAQTTRALH